jgi:hypothetical protein
VFRATEGSTARLVQLCAAYFGFYVVTGVTVKYFRDAGLGEMQFLAYSTLGGSLLCLGVAIAFGWWRLQSIQRVALLGMQVPVELAYIVPSGVCTAVVIPATTLLYSLPISVMVAMVIMRGSVIVISRSVDAIQIRQGILKKKVFFEEDVAVGFALLAVASVLLWAPIARRLGVAGAETVSFEFLKDPFAVAVLSSYVVAYSFRIYIMNYFKNTRGKGVKQDNKGFFAIEQIAASVVLIVAAFLVFQLAPGTTTVDAAGKVLTETSIGARLLDQFHGAIANPPALWLAAVTIGGFPYGGVAFFSVFIFMFQGRTATFAGLVNRLTSLLAGTTATLITWATLSGKFPKPQEWLSLAFIFVAVGFLTLAERKRAAAVSPPPVAVPAAPAPQA